MYLAAQNGQRVVCVTATYGDAGKTADETKWPQANLANIRKQELKNSLDILGVKEHMWLTYKDGQLINSNETQGVATLVDIINQINPDSIFSFGPDGITGHDDHKTIHHWTRQAVAQSGTKATFYTNALLSEKLEESAEAHQNHDIFFNTDKPVAITKDQADLFLQFDQATVDAKIKALQAQECQTAAMFSDPAGLSFIQKSCQCEAFLIHQNE